MTISLYNNTGLVNKTHFYYNIDEISLSVPDGIKETKRRQTVSNFCFLCVGRQHAQ
jgi:hypothetical protein